METKKSRFRFLDLLYYGIYSMIFKAKKYKVGQDHNRILVYYTLYISISVMIFILLLLHFTNHIKGYISFIKIIFIPIYLIIFYLFNRYFDVTHYVDIIQKFDIEIGKKRGRTIGIICLLVFLFMAFGVPFILSHFK